MSYTRTPARDFPNGPARGYVLGNVIAAPAVTAVALVAGYLLFAALAAVVTIVAWLMWWHG